MTSERESPNSFRRLWRTYRALPLSEQFKWEWYAFGIAAGAWGLFCIVWAVFA